MKKQILLILLLCSINCAAQNKINKNINNKKNKAMYIDLLRNKPEVSKDFETFDFEKYQKPENKNKVAIEETLDDGTYIKSLNAKGKGGKWYSKTPKNSCFSIFKLYYPNGNIKEKGLSYNESTGSDAKFGVWYYFDENGKFLREINHEKDCNVNFEQIYYICSKEEIPLSIGYIRTWSDASNYTVIFKNQNPQTGHWYWKIQYHKSLYSQYLQLEIDGETGKIIDRQNRQIVTGEGLSQTETNVIDEQQPVKKEGFWKRNFGI